MGVVEERAGDSLRTCYDYFRKGPSLGRADRAATGSIGGGKAAEGRSFHFAPPRRARRYTVVPPLVTALVARVGLGPLVVQAAGRCPFNEGGAPSARSCPSGGSAWR